MATSSRKPPLLGDGGPVTYAKFGSWKLDFAAYLSRNGLGIYSSLDDSMLRAYPSDPKKAADSEIQQAYIAATERFTCY